MPLTDVAIQSLKPGAKSRRMSDGHGLFIEVTPGGSKLWRVAYRYGEKQRLHAIGPYPEHSLVDARKERTKLRAQLAAGLDPAIEKRREAAAEKQRKVNTLAVVADDWINRKVAEGKAARTIDKIKWLVKIVTDRIGEYPVSDIRASDLLPILRAVEKAGKRETARRLRGTLSEIFRFAVACGLADQDPAAPLVGALAAPIVKHRAAVVEPIPFGGLLRAIHAYDGQITTQAGLRLLALTALRPGELRAAQWAEINFDEALWVIPAGRMKQRKPFAVPLATQALAILRDLHEITGAGALVFPGYGKSVQRPAPGEEPVKTALVQRCISENTLNAGLRRLGYGADEVVSHGFRSSFSTLMHATGKFPADHIEAALAHYRGDVRSVYDRNTFLHERRALMQFWADKCDTLRTGGDVVPIKRKAKA